MHGILSGAMTAGLLATAVFVVIGQNGQDDPRAAREALVEPAFSAETEGTTYRLQIGGGAQSCILEKGAGGVDGRFEATAGPKCPELYPPLAEVRFWRQKDEGTVELARADGTTVLELMVSDGFAYETFRPGSPPISLAALAE